MRRIHTIFAAAAISICMFAVDIVARVVAFARELVPTLVKAEPVSISNGHPRSIFEARRFGLA